MSPTTLPGIVPAAAANAIDFSHAVLWKILLASIGLHVLAIVGYAAVKGQDLVLPLITGTKVLPEPVIAPRMASPARAAVLFVGSAVAAILIAWFM
jgi:hypothetical protein